MQDTRSTRTGRSGEHYVCYLIEQAGLEAVRVDGRADLHVTLHSGRLLRVEVKACTKRYGHIYKFHMGQSQADMFAFVAFGDTPIVRILLTKDVPKWSLPITDFTKEKQEADLEWLVNLV